MNEYLSKEFIAKILDAHLEDSRGAEHYAYDIIKRELMVAPGISIEQDAIIDALYKEYESLVHDRKIDWLD